MMISLSRRQRRIEAGAVILAALAILAFIVLAVARAWSGQIENRKSEIENGTDATDGDRANASTLRPEPTGLSSPRLPSAATRSPIVSGTPSVVFFYNSGNRESGLGNRATWTVTAYCPCRRCCGPAACGVTASGTRADHRLAAGPPEMPFGTVVAVPGYGTVKCEDRGGAIKGRRLDVLFANHGEARAWGVRQLQCRVRGESCRSRST